MSRLFQVVLLLVLFAPTAQAQSYPAKAATSRLSLDSLARSTTARDDKLVRPLVKFSAARETGRGKRIGAFALGGFVVGATAGGVIAYNHARNCDACWGSSQWIAVAAVGGGVVGAAAGAVVGALWSVRK